MRQNGLELELSASDLGGHLDCHHLTSLDFAVARGSLSPPKSWDPLPDTIRLRGEEHERDFISHLVASGLAVTAIEGKGVDAASLEATRKAIEGGAAIITQAALAAHGWVGRADALRRL